MANQLKESYSWPFMNGLTPVYYFRKKVTLIVQIHLNCRFSLKQRAILQTNLIIFKDNG